MTVLVRTSDLVPAYITQQIYELHGYGADGGPPSTTESGPGDSGALLGVNPSEFPRESATCPAGGNCVPVSGTEGMFERDTDTDTIYFTDEGYDKAVLGSQVSWWDVASDLLQIVAASGGSVALGTFGIICSFVNLAHWTIDFFGGTDNGDE